MISREEKNQIYVDEINKEKNIKIIKIILKILGIMIFLFAIFFAYSYFIEPSMLKTNEYIINDNYPNSFNGIKILHISDLLYGSTIKKDNLEKISKEIELINPDIIMFTGNIISNEYSVNEKDINYLKDFFTNMPYSIGKYAIKGDVDTNTFDLIIEKSDFIILNNEMIEIYNNDNSKINIVGIGHNEKMN